MVYIKEFSSRPCRRECRLAGFLFGGCTKRSRLQVFLKSNSIFSLNLLGYVRNLCDGDVKLHIAAFLAVDWVSGGYTRFHGPNRRNSAFIACHDCELMMSKGYFFKK